MGVDFAGVAGLDVVKGLVLPHILDATGELSPDVREVECQRALLVCPVDQCRDSPPTRQRTTPHFISVL